MTDQENNAFMHEQQRLYAAGELPKWKIERLEKIPGWSWGNTSEPSQDAEPKG